MHRLLIPLACLASLACDDAAPAMTPPTTPLDAQVIDADQPTDLAASPDAAPPADAAPMDAGPDQTVDSGVTCTPRPADPTPDAPLPPRRAHHAGVDAWEATTWDRLRVAAAADPAVHFIATFDHATDALVIDAAAGRIEARRVDGRWTVTDGALVDVFPSTAADQHPTLADIFAAFEPYPDDRENLGYTPDDPRVGGLPLAAQSWPDPLVRLGTIFDAAHAPDGVIGLWPWARGGNGTHGGLGLLQSRAALMLAGKGARPGEHTIPARLVDVAPTVLAALGAPTTGGIGPDGAYSDGLFMRWQDGQVLWDALAEDPCDRPRHVVIVLFDGLTANDLNHQALSPTPDVDLPTIRALATDAAIFPLGAIAGFPSMSAPGHMTIGTGAWPGHHGILNNRFFDRGTQARVDPLAFASDPAGFAMDPAAAFAFHDVYVPPEVETLAAAAHRAFGPWDAATETGAYVAVLNDIPVGDADFTTADYLMGARHKALSTSRIADELATVQATTLLGTPEAPIPTILQVGLASTDSVGETHGPYSPFAREVLAELDADLGRIVAAYDRAGALDDTLFVLVSDHGMELQDPARAGGFQRVLNAADVRTSEASFGVVYLRTLEVEAEAIEAGFEVRVRNHDDGTPVADATVTCEGCDGVMTDVAGSARVPSIAALVVTHPDFNPAQLTD